MEVVVHWEEEEGVLFCTPLEVVVYWEMEVVLFCNQLEVEAQGEELIWGHWQ